MESYIRGLQSLGQGQDSFGNQLVPVILEKLPADVKRNMTRDHGNNKWQLQDLRQALKRQIGILESGLPTLSQRYTPLQLLSSQVQVESQEGSQRSNDE